MYDIGTVKVLSNEMPQYAYKTVAATQQDRFKKVAVICLNSHLKHDFLLNQLTSSKGG